MTHQESVLEYMEEVCPEALTFDGFEEALVGVAHHWAPVSVKDDDGTIRTGATQVTVAVYDYQRMVLKLVEDGLTPEEAEEYLHFNTLGAYVGEYTPVVVNLGGEMAGATFVGYGDY